MKGKKFQIRKEEARKAIESSIIKKTGIEVDVWLCTDQINVHLTNYERYGFEGRLRLNWDTQKYDHVEYNIGTWGSIDPNETLAGLYAVFGMIMADKGIQELIEGSMKKLTAIAERKEDDNE